MNPSNLLRFFCAALAFLIGLQAFAPRPACAADHLDANITIQDPAADIADVFTFLDPTDIAQVVLIATVHPYIIPGQNTTSAAFDENVRYRFEIYNNHVNLPSPVLDDGSSAAARAAYVAKVKPKLLIDVAFSKRQVGPEQQTNAGGTAFIPPNLRRPKLQTATLSLQGFKDPDGHNLINNGRFPVTGGSPLSVTATNLATTAPAFNVQNVTVAPGQIVQFFAGAADDPFFFDLPAFTSYLDGIRNTGVPTVAAFSRMRDTFAGYNVLAIALRIPLALVQGANGPNIGVDFLTQRHRSEIYTPKALKGAGKFVTVDRMGHPFVNNLLIPFDQRDAYNAATAKSDVSLKFSNMIFETLNEYGVVTNPPETSATTLANRFIARGDLLLLDTSISNFDNPANALYPNGRRLQDDTVDIVLTTINHNNSVGDGVANSGSLATSFPFLGQPNQPLVTGSGTDDATRN
jgi:hypothetical protein